MSQERTDPHFVLKDLNTGESFPLYHRDMRYIGSGGNSDAFYLNIPSDKVIKELNRQSQIIEEVLDSLAIKLAQIKPELTQEEKRRGYTKPAFTDEQYRRILKLKAQIEEASQKQLDIKKRIQIIEKNQHPLFGERVLRVSRNKFQKEGGVILELDEEIQQSRMTNLESQIYGQEENKPGNFPHCLGTDEAKYFQFDLLDKCTLTCPRNGYNLEAQICYYSSFGDLDFVLDKYLSSVGFQRSMDVIYWAFLRMQELLVKVHSKEFVHGDFKPANVLLNKNLSLRLVDYDFMNKVNTVAKLGGTPGFVYPYLSPSDLISENNKKLYPYLYEFDTFALGATLLRLLLGKFEGRLFDETDYPTLSLRFQFLGSSSGKEPYELEVLNFERASIYYGPIISSKLSKLSCNSEQGRLSLIEQNLLASLCLFLTMPKIGHGKQAAAARWVFFWGGLSSLAVLEDRHKSFQYQAEKRKNRVWSAKYWCYQDEWETYHVPKPVKKISDLVEFLNTKKKTLIKEPPAKDLYRLLFNHRVCNYVGAKMYAHWVEQIQYHIDELQELFDKAYASFGCKYLEDPYQSSGIASMGASAMLQSTFNNQGGTPRQTVFDSVYKELFMAAQQLCKLIGTMPSGQINQFPGFDIARDDDHFLGDVAVRISSVGIQGSNISKIESKHVRFSGLNLQKDASSYRLEFSKLYGHPDTYHLKNARCLQDINFMVQLPKRENAWLNPEGILEQMKLIFQETANQISQAKNSAALNSACNGATQSTVQHALLFLSQREGKNLQRNLKSLLLEEDMTDLESKALSILLHLTELARLLRPHGTELEVDVVVDEPEMQRYLQTLPYHPLDLQTAEKFAREAKQNLCSMQSVTMCKMMDAVKPGLHEQFFKHVNVGVKFKWDETSQDNSVSKLKKMIESFKSRLQRIQQKPSSNPK